MEISVGSTLYGRSGERIGTVTDVINHPIDLHPEWVAVRIGLLRREHLVPVSAVEDRDGVLTTFLDDDTVKHSPVLHEHVTPTLEESAALRAHFDMN